MPLLGLDWYFGVHCTAQQGVREKARVCHAGVCHAFWARVYDDETMDYEYYYMVSFIFQVLTSVFSIVFVLLLFQLFAIICNYASIIQTYVSRPGTETSGAAGRAVSSF
jgi:hypothetical protein